MFVKGQSGFAGRKHKPETVAKMKERLDGKVPWNLGKTDFNSIEFKQKLRQKMSGEKNHNWKGGVTSINEKERKTPEYKAWRKAVFERDDYTCQFCGVRGVELNADHIKPFAIFHELRLELSNGRTLCKPCHLKTDTWGVKGTAHL